MKNTKNLNKFLLPILSGRHFSVVLYVIIFFLLTSTVSFTQTTEKKYSFGALLLKKEQYAKLPRPNWDTLRKYSNLKIKSSKSTKSIVTLTSPPIGNQGYQGSCTAWAAGYAALSTLAYPKYNCWDIASRSPAYIFNQIKINCIDGAYLWDAVELVKDQGSCSLNLMQYNENDCSTQPNSTQTFEASKHNAINGYAIYPYTDIDEIKQAIDLGYPVPCAFDVYESFIDDWEDDGIWDSQNSGDKLGSHAVCIVGYDDVQELFKVQNSWGVNGGDEGFFWVTFDLVEEGYIKELYILYGMNAAYPEYISGNSLICTSGQTFTLENPPSGCTFSWDKSSNLTLSSAWDNYATFTANTGASGSGYIQVSVNSCSFTLPQKNVWVGVPILNVSGPGSGYTYHTYTFYANPGTYSNPSSYTWILNPLNGNYVYNYGSYADIAFYNPGGYQVISRAQNTCGTGEYSWKGIGISGGKSYSLSPNPASDNVTITMIENITSGTNIDNDITGTASVNMNLSNVVVPTNFTIRIFNSQGSLLSSFTRSGKSFNVPLNNMHNGIYIIEVNDGKNSYRQQLIVKHD